MPRKRTADRLSLFRAWTRFNEAGAIMPRKRGVSVVSSFPCSARFNEAGAIMPRKQAPLIPFCGLRYFDKMRALRPVSPRAPEPS